MTEFLRRHVLTFVSMLAFFAVTCQAASATACLYEARGFAALPDGKSYAIQLDAHNLFTGDIKLELWSATAKYSIDLPHFSIDQVSNVEEEPIPRWSSVHAPIQVIELLTPDDILAVRVEPSEAAANGFACYANTVVSMTQRIAETPRYRSYFEHERTALLRAASVSGSAHIVAPSGEPVPPASCAHPFEEAAVLVPKTPEYPEIARMLGQTGTVFVDVALAANGTVTRASIAGSSHSPSLDDAALHAAKGSTYRAGVFRCESQSGEYEFRADFSASAR